MVDIVGPGGRVVPVEVEEDDGVELTYSVVVAIGKADAVVVELDEMVTAAVVD